MNAALIYSMNNSHEKKARRIATLLAGYMRDNLTPAEHDELDEWVGASDKNMRLFEELTDERRVQLALDLLNDNNQSGLVKKLKEDKDFKYPSHRPYRLVRRIGIAASIAIALSVGTYFIYPSIFGKSKSSGEIAKSNEVIPLPVAPAKESAELTTVNGTKFTMDTVRNGYFAMQGDIEIEKSAGGIRYAVKKSKQITESRNILTTAKGKYYNIFLPDGTKAKLNANSSISYPVPFLGTNRRVSITGEVYFDVASAKEKGLNYGRPFIVDIPDRNMTVEVMGTHFNVNAYSDEKFVKTTLIEGSVKVSAGGKTGLLKPGQQAIVGSDGVIQVENVETSFAIAWMDHVLKAKENNLRSTLNILCRWYDLDLEFPQDTNDTNLTSSNTVTLNLDNPIQESLNALNKTTPHVHFEVKGRRLVVAVTPS